MLFLLGIIIGLLIAALIFATLAFFRSAIEKQVHVTRAQIEALGPKPKGGIFLPEDENEITRQEVIRKNSAQGKDTPLKDLM